MSTGYASGMRKYRVSILNRTAATVGEYGIDSGGVAWATDAVVWAAVDWAKGVRSLNAGAIDAYAVILVRMNYNTIINNRSRIQYDGATYQILPETFHVDKRDNKIQFNAQAVLQSDNN